jgi:hypothetical protein
MARCGTITGQRSRAEQSSQGNASRGARTKPKPAEQQKARRSATPCSGAGWFCPGSFRIYSGFLALIRTNLTSPILKPYCGGGCKRWGEKEAQGTSHHWAGRISGTRLWGFRQSPAIQPAPDAASPSRCPTHPAIPWSQPGAAPTCAMSGITRAPLMVVQPALNSPAMPWRGGLRRSRPMWRRTFHLTLWAALNATNTRSSTRTTGDTPA